MRDVIIVGGGPGGLHTAARLAGAGFDVALYEEHAACGDPVHCTGVLADEAFTEFDLPRDVVLNPLASARFYSPTGLTVAYTTPTIEAVVVDRRLLDVRLFQRACAAGVTTQLGQRVTGIAVDGHGVSVTLATGASARARACVIACGASYALQRTLGLGMPQVFLQSAQMELPAGRLGDVEIRFGQAVAPLGFGWVVPVRRDHGSFARIGLMCARDSRSYFDRLLRDVAPRWAIDAESAEGARLSPRQKILPLAPIPRTVADRVLAIGDAAGLVKATTGGGIYYSLVSGDLAANVLADGLAHDRLRAAALEPYEKAWRCRLGPEIQAQLRLRHIAHRLRDQDIDAFFELAATDGVMPIVRRTARFNRHRDLILSLLSHPPARRVLLRTVAARLTVDSATMTSAEPSQN
jgi:geranylgeranyl reductase family protein